jgi:hypothetical protein
MHIVTGPVSKREKGSDRRDRLKKAAKKHMVDAAAILFSFEAHACLETV